jgi:hypothetical protein
MSLKWKSVLGGMALVGAVSAVTAAQSAKSGEPQQPALMERQREIALALSACPPAVAAKAGVYVLEKSGYVKARDSQNGFTALVQHSMPASQEPQCMDAEGARTLLTRMLKVAELRAQGKSRHEVEAFVTDATAKGVFPAPTRPGVDYMLSTQNLVANAKGQVVPFPPHVMFYGTHLKNVDLGVDGSDLDSLGNPKGPTFVAGEESPYALIIVPVAAHTHGRRNQ